jgi:phosphoribosylanthranilate isomerase
MAHTKTQIFCRRPTLGEMDALFAMGADMVGWEISSGDWDTLMVSRAITDRARKVGVGTTLMVHSSSPFALESAARMVAPDHLLVPAGLLDEARMAALAAALPDGTRLMASVPVRPSGSTSRLASKAFASAYERFAGSLITDTCVSDEDLKQCGCTGITSDWEVCAEILAATDKPVMIAGGLSVGNVGAAVRLLSPWAVDACTSLELPDRSKNLRLCEAFIEAVRSSSTRHDEREMSIFGRADPEVYLITARHEEQDGGMIATWVVPGTLARGFGRVLAVLSARSHTRGLIERSGRFVVHALAEDQWGLLPRFGHSSGHDVNKFDGLTAVRSARGIPVIDGCLGFAECRVEGRIEGGDRTVYLADVIHQKVHSHKAPLRQGAALSRLPPDIASEMRRRLALDAERDENLIRNLS